MNARHRRGAKVPDEYALWRMPSINLSIRCTSEAGGFGPPC